LVGIPDVLGLRLQKAEEILNAADIPYRVSETAPPPGRRKDGSEEIRVVRQSSEEGCEILLVCRI